MKRAISLFACLALLALGGCGTPNNGVEWATVDLLDEAYADVKVWLEEIDNRDIHAPELETFNLSDNHELLVKNWANEIYLVDKKTKEETLLLSGGSPQPGGPNFCAVHNERYFIFQWIGGGVGTIQSVCAYDIENREEIRLDTMDGMWLHFAGLRGDYAYLGDASYDMPPSGTRHLVRIDLRKLPDVEPVNLLKGIRHAKYKNGKEFWVAKVSPEGGTYMLGLDIYDLENRRFLAAVPSPPDGGIPYYYDEKTIYCPIYSTDIAM